MRYRTRAGGIGWLVLLFWVKVNGLHAQGWDPLPQERWFGEEVKTWSLRQEHALSGLILQAAASTKQGSGVSSDLAHEEVKALAQCLHAVAHRRAEADRLCEDFLRLYPTHPSVSTVQLAYAIYLGQEERYTDARSILDSMNWYSLGWHEAQQYHYLQGFLRINSDTASAAGHWLQALGSVGPYRNAARYALLVLRMQQGQAVAMLDLVQELEKDSVYRERCSYPSAWARTLQGDTLGVMLTLDSLRKRSLNLTDAQGLMRLGLRLSYAQAQSASYTMFWKAATDAGYPPSVDDTLRWCSMLSLQGSWDTVLNLVKGLESWPDSLKTTAYGMMGWAWLGKAGDGGPDRYKARARAAFQRITEREVDGSQREKAFYLYAKLSYEVGESPSNFRALAAFLQQYPQSIYREELSEYLSDLAMRAHHYQESLRILRSVSQKTKRLQGLLQRLYYQQGLTWFNQRRFVECLPYLDSSLLYPVDSNLRAATMFWKSELYHKVGEYNQALLWMKNFVDADCFNATLRSWGCHLLAANYQLGHLSFRLERPTQAVRYLSLAVQEGKTMGDLNDVEAAMHRDAYTRLADAYLRDGQIEAAIRQFNFCINELRTDVDYARYQIAICYGIIKNNDRKRQQLSSLIDQNPPSDYRMYALMELAMTAYQESSFDSALWCIRQIRQDYPRHRLAFVAMNLQGSVYLEQQNDSLAMTVFEEVIKEAAGLPEAKDALFELRQWCIRNNQPQKYLDIAGKNGLLALQDDPRDSILFESAQYSLDAGKFFEALAAYTQYLQEYPGGSFKANALYYRAVAAEKVGDPETLRRDLEALLKMPQNLFTERAMLKLATVYMGIKNLQGSADVYRKLLEGTFSQSSRLDAVMGLVRAYTLLKEYVAVDSLVKRFGSGPEWGRNNRDELLWHAANATRYRGQTSIAQRMLRNLADSSTNEWAARSLYDLASIAYDRKDYSVSQDILFDLTDRWPQFSEWYGRGLLLLADNLVAVKEKEQAIAVLQNLIEGREPDEITRTAENRLKEWKP
ncbi:MAG: tetratricopeptide repeat protein [Bacteroidota bacterium]